MGRRLTGVWHGVRQARGGHRPQSGCRGARTGRPAPDEAEHSALCLAASAILTEARAYCNEHIPAYERSSSDYRVYAPSLSVISLLPTDHHAAM
eukprot:scaffold4174_cov122-Isochrysis_galbana.AAC.4